MFCPYCGNEKTRVGATVKGLETVRFRRCDKCGNTWTTVESVKPNDEYLENFISVTKSRSDRFCKPKDKA